MGMVNQARLWEWNRHGIDIDIMRYQGRGQAAEAGDREGEGEGVVVVGGGLSSGSLCREGKKTIEDGRSMRKRLRLKRYSMGKVSVR